MTKLSLLLIAYFLYSCSPPVPLMNTLSDGEIKLRERFSFNINENVDSRNILFLNFYSVSRYQLIELNLHLNKGNSSFITVINSDLQNKKSDAPISNANVEIFLNGNSVTQCLIDQCNNSQCSITTGAVANLKMGFETDRLNLNLSKVVNDTSCNAGINEGKMNTLEFRIVNDSAINPSFINIDANIVTFKRAYIASRMTDFENGVNNEK